MGNTGKPCDSRSSAGDSGDSGDSRSTAADPDLKRPI